MRIQQDPVEQNEQKRVLPGEATCKLRSGKDVGSKPSERVVHRGRRALCCPKPIVRLEGRCASLSLDVRASMVLIVVVRGIPTFLLKMKAEIAQVRGAASREPRDCRPVMQLLLSRHIQR